MGTDDRFRMLFEHAPSGMAILSVDGRFTDVNRELCKILGYDEQELHGRAVDEFIHPDDYLGGAARTRLLKGELGSVQIDRRFLHRDGTIIWLKGAISLVRDDERRPLYFVAQYEDVTRAKRLELELDRERLWLVESQASGKTGSWEYDREGLSLRWSREQFKLYGLDPDGEPPSVEELLALIHPDDREALVESLRVQVESGQDLVNEHRIWHPLLGERHLHVQGRHLPADPETGRPARLAGTSTDVTADRAAAADRQRDEERLRLLATIVQKSDDAIVVVSQEGLVTQWNGGATQLYGWSAEEAIGQSIGFLVPPELGSEAMDLTRRAASGDPVRQLHTTRMRKDGSTVQVSLTVMPIVDDKGRTLAVSGVARDITEQVQARERLLGNERLLYDAQALAHVGSWEWDLAQPRPEWSAELKRIYGYSPNYPPGADDLTLRVHPDDRAMVDQLIAEARRGVSNEAEYRIVLRGGDLRYVHGRHHTRTDDQGEVTHLYGTVQDVTERKRYESELERLATHDSLTGLPNRRRFEERLGEELARCRREGRTLSLAVLDVDNFKRINDTLGHPVGDLVLCGAAQALAQQVRSHELIARVGGEEFAWILPGAAGEGALTAVERARQAVAQVDFGDAGHITLSAGICVLSDGLDAGALYRQADLALLAAKHGGRDRAVLADPDDGLELAVAVAGSDA